jgi:alpha-N-arabinofuranosidase
MILETEMRGFGSYRVAEHIILEGTDPKDTNTKENPNKVVPHSNGNAAIEDDKVMATLPKLSWNVIRLNKS